MYNIYYIYVVCIYTIYIKRTPEYPIIVSEKCPVRSSHPQIQKNTSVLVRWCCNKKPSFSRGIAGCLIWGSDETSIFWWFPGVSPMAFPIISYYISMNCSSTSPLSLHKPGSLAQAYILFPEHLEAPSWGWNPGWRWSRSSKFLHLLMTCPLHLTLCRLYVVLFFQDFRILDDVRWFFRWF